MLKTKDTQFKLDDSGQILYQPVENNPLPGKAVARIVKGERSLSPAIEILDEADLGGADKDAVRERLQEWLTGHIKEVLGPLAALSTPEESEAEPVRSIATKIYEHMGIIPREMLEDEIGKLDADMRRVLRGKKIRLGPVLVFIPALNKPAAVHLRAVLWALWNGRDLPPAVPQDGVVSFSVAGEGKVDEEFYRAIAYPVYGGRAIRVDMLDRLITAVYDSADKGVFKARHEMAEWLGSSVPDLYAVLESMGHTKLHDPADEEKTKDKTPTDVEDKKAEETKTAVQSDNADNEAQADEKTSADKPEQKETQPQAEKPELATFRLKRGKAYQAKKAHNHEGSKGGAAAGKHNKAKSSKKFDKAKKAKSKQYKKDYSSQPKVISAAAPKSKPEDSPFAVLQQLKAGSKDEK